MLQPQLQIQGIGVSYQEKEPGFCCPGETRPEWELCYADGGTLHAVTDGIDLTLQQGDMVLYGAGQFRMQYAPTDIAPRFVTVTFSASGMDLTRLCGRVLRHPGSDQVIRQILAEQERADECSADLIRALLIQLLLTLYREPERTVRPQTAHALHCENQIILRAQRYISSHIRDRLSVPTVARMVDVSPSYLTALFQKHMALSPGQYIRRVKLQEGKQLIRRNEMNFTEIAAALHYSSVHHFSRQFKESFGITPTEYAKSVR